MKLFAIISALGPLVGACGFTARAGDDELGGAPPCTSWAQHFDACALPAPPTTGLLIGAGISTFNTSTGTLSPAPAGGSFVAIDNVPGGPFVMWVESFRIIPQGTLHVIGDKPLIIAANTTIIVEGIIDAGSKQGGQTSTTLGAGANPSSCSNHAATAGLAKDKVSGGGGGGANGGAGGAGGTGKSGGVSAGGAGGAVVDVPDQVTGGCPGANAGGPGGGDGGPGGGAIELAAQISLVNSGEVLAGGAGGQSRVSDSFGGGGGGSGGLISFDSPMMTISGMIAANGGGGGGGGDPGAGNAGKAGADGGASTMQAAGGPGKQVGGKGGSIMSPPGESLMMSTDGGGGGGGGVGFILVRGTLTTSATWSPMYTQTP